MNDLAYQLLKAEFWQRARRMRLEYQSLIEAQEKLHKRWKVQAICPDLSDAEADEISLL